MDIWLIRIRCSTSSHLVLVQVTDFMPLPSCCIENIYTFSICTKTIYYSVNFALIFLIITTVKLCPSLLMNSVSYFPEIFSSCCCWVWLKVFFSCVDYSARHRKCPKLTANCSCVRKNGAVHCSTYYYEELPVDSKSGFRFGVLHSASEIRLRMQDKVI